MPLSRMLWPVAVALAGLAGWHVAIAAIPSICSDQIWDAMLNNGSRLNTLKQPSLRLAPSDVAPLANADTIPRSVIYDLSKGPLLFEAEVPRDLAYWSVSVFARNSDTLLVTNDRKIASRRYRLIVRLAGQRSTVPADATIVSPSTRGYLLVRAVTKDRNDSADVAATMAATRAERATILPDKAVAR